MLDKGCKLKAKFVCSGELETERERGRRHKMPKVGRIFIYTTFKVGCRNCGLVAIGSLYTIVEELKGE